MIGALLLIAWVANWLTKRVLLRGLRRALHASRAVRESDAQFKVVPRLANVVPALVLWLGVGVVPHLPEEVVLVVRNVCSAFVILTLALAIAKSLVASMQISSNDMVPVGDWIEMPQQNADGDVIDIALHTVKVQNWDKTITTIPTKKLISDSFKNWRGMSEAGGRRIKRSLYLDQHSVRFLGEEECSHMQSFALLDDYMDRTQKELDAWNADLAARGLAPVNARRVTNLGTFRAYVDRYLRKHPGIHQDMTLLVRQLQPESTGLPLEIYCFTNDIRWTEYERIQADIFDHLLAILPEFDLRVFQQSSDAATLAAMLQMRAPAAATSP